MNRLKGKVVLVTGAAGFIGSQLAARLSSVDNIRLLLLTRANRSALEEGSEWLTAELGSLTKEFWSSKGIGKIDYVFHLAAFTPKSGMDSSNIDQVIDDNIQGTRALLSSLPGKPEKFVFSSTLDVYATPEGVEALSERSRGKPMGLYGASKLFCESLVSAWGQQHSVDYSILRYGHIYGPGEERYKKLIPTVIRGLLKNQGPTTYGDGGALGGLGAVLGAVLGANAVQMVTMRLNEAMGGHQVANIGLAGGECHGSSRGGFSPCFPSPLTLSVEVGFGCLFFEGGVAAWHARCPSTRLLFRQGAAEATRG